MSESFKPLDPLSELDRLAVDLDFDSDSSSNFDASLRPTPNRPLDDNEASPHSARKQKKVRMLPVGIRSLSNSPGAAPHPAPARESSLPARDARSEDLPALEPGTGAAESDSAPKLQPVRRARAVRVDAWAVPASANWTRTHKTARKIRRVSRSTDWALPF